MPECLPSLLRSGTLRSRFLRRDRDPTSLHEVHRGAGRTTTQGGSLKIAVVGAGISGLSCAWRLASNHDVTLYEAGGYFGGHTHTVDATVDGVTHPVDTGFLVFNHRTYPEFTRLLDQLGVEVAASEMTFSVSVGTPRGPALEWAGTDINSVFAQRRNLARPAFLRMLLEIVRFNRLATRLATSGSALELEESLGAFLARENFGESFRLWYLLPMAAAIWSCPTATMMAFPMATFVRFCHNHGLLQVMDRPQWYTIKNGAHNYVEKLLAALDDVRLNQPVLAIRRGTAEAPEVTVTTAVGSEQFDQVVLAAHSDESLAMLTDASPEESQHLLAIKYQKNRAVLHTDATLLPKAVSAWAAWNYQCLQKSDGGREDVCVHYLLNLLQPTPFKRPLLVSLNSIAAPREETVLQEFEYSHPVFDQAAIRAQEQIAAAQGTRGTWYAGAWTGFGFHEDGLRSGLTVAARINALPQTDGCSHQDAFQEMRAA
jgi:uncharacterized protein